MHSHILPCHCYVKGNGNVPIDKLFFCICKSAKMMKQPLHASQLWQKTMTAFWGCSNRFNSTSNKQGCCCCKVGFVWNQNSAAFITLTLHIGVFMVTRDQVSEEKRHEGGHAGLVEWVACKSPFGAGADDIRIEWREFQPRSFNWIRHQRQSLHLQNLLIIHGGLPLITQQTHTQHDLTNTKKHILIFAACMHQNFAVTFIHKTTCQHCEFEICRYASVLRSKWSLLTQGKHAMQRCKKHRGVDSEVLLSKGIIGAHFTLLVVHDLKPSEPSQD